MDIGISFAERGWTFTILKEWVRHSVRFSGQQKECVRAEDRTVLVPDA